MDNHDKAHYAIGAVALLAAAGNGVYTAEKPKDVETRVVQGNDPRAMSGPSQAQMEALKTWISSQKKQPIRFVCGGQCGEFADNIEQVFDESGWETSEEVAIGSWTGLIVSPADDEGHKIADAITQATQIPVQVSDVDKGGLALLVGRRAAK